MVFENSSPHSLWYSFPFFLVVSGEHFQYHDNQFSQSRRSECHAIMGDLLHILCLWRSLRIRNHFTSNENQNVSQIGSLYAEGRDLCHGCCGLDCLPYRLPYIQYRLLGRLSPVKQHSKVKNERTLFFSSSSLVFSSHHNCLIKYLWSLLERCILSLSSKARRQRLIIVEPIWE